MKKILYPLILIFSSYGITQNHIYFSKVFGHIHVKPYANSSSVTGISCGEKLKKDISSKSIEQDWVAVEFGTKKGFVYKEHVTSQEPPCLQGEYPIFFQALELDLTEIFLWGRLNDQFIEFETGR